MPAIGIDVGWVPHFSPQAKGGGRIEPILKRRSDNVESWIVESPIWNRQSMVPVRPPPLLRKDGAPTPLIVECRSNPLGRR